MAHKMDYFGTIIMTPSDLDPIYLNKDEFKYVKNEIMCTGLAPVVFFEVTDISGKKYIVNKAQIALLDYREVM